MSEDARVTALLEAAAERDAAGGAPLSDEQAAAAGGEESGASGANEGLDEVQLAASSGTPSPARSPQPQQPPAAPVDGAAGEAPGDAQPRPQASPLPQQSVASPRAVRC